MCADIHGGPEHKTLQSKAGYIAAGPSTAESKKLLATHGRTIHSGQRGCMPTVANGPTIPSAACADRHLGSPSDGQPSPMTSRRFIDRTTGADRSNWQPRASSMIRLMLRAHRPHFGRQPKHLYTWPVVVGSRTAVAIMVRTSRSVRTLQEQMIMKASPARCPGTPG